MQGKYIFECTDCKARYDGDQFLYLCPSCSEINRPDQPPAGVLKVLYAYDEIRQNFHGRNLFGSLMEERFLSLMPLKDNSSWTQLRIGNTPLYRYPYVSSSGEKFSLYLKDDSQNPTFSFKDRASALVSAYARENNIDTIITASTGNAGSSLAGICASQGQRSFIFVPATAPLAKLVQILMYGATLVTVKGTYDQAFELSTSASELYGFFNRNTAFNPFTIEGKKTVAFELFHQMNNDLPDLIFVPAGDGVILSGVYKGFEDLMKLGITEKMPKIVAVQAEGSGNIMNNLNRKEFISQPSSTIADSISVDVPRNYFMSAGFLQEYHGECVSVTDQEIIQNSLKLSRNTGIFSEPAAVAAYCGMKKYADGKKIPSGAKVVVLLTGSGLKDPGAVKSAFSLPEPVEPCTESLKNIFH